MFSVRATPPVLLHPVPLTVTPTKHLLLLLLLAVPDGRQSRVLGVVLQLKYISYFHPDLFYFISTWLTFLAGGGGVGGGQTSHFTLETVTLTSPDGQSLLTFLRRHRIY